MRTLKKVSSFGHRDCCVLHIRVCLQIHMLKPTPKVMVLGGGTRAREGGTLMNETYKNLRKLLCLFCPLRPQQKKIAVGEQLSRLSGVPVVAQWLTNPTWKHDVVSSIPGLAQWVRDPALP